MDYGGCVCSERAYRVSRDQKCAFYCIRVPVLLDCGLSSVEQSKLVDSVTVC